MVKQFGILVLVFLVLTGCGVEKDKSNEEKLAEAELKKSPEFVADNSLTPIDEAISKAITERDFRLFGITGRHVMIPGFAPENQDEVKSRCGIKPMPGYKDNFKSSEERKALKTLREYAKAYNLKMYEHCLKKG